ncbi:MAG: hypothetical protein SV775_07155 [Thermodesulfobacteriota bacterium]|nr:hypothetical protein [Thermodesulfobacteriota bacterium]
MVKDEKRKRRDDSSLTVPSSSELRARQSVRATFKLTGKAIDILSIVSAQLGVKQKYIFDHLMGDVESLNKIARDIQHRSFKRLDRSPKTFVLSRKTLCCLDETSKKFDAPRDALVEYSIKRLLPVINEEREKHEKRKEVSREMAEYVKQGEKIAEKSKELLGGGDPVYEEFINAITGCRNAQRNIEAFIEKGDSIEDY